MSENSLLVACLCARWCGLCGDYRATFDAARERLAGQVRFVWIDIEDDDALVGQVDIDDFPTLLIASAEAALFFGPLTPQPATLDRLLQSARAGRLSPLADAQSNGLAARLREAAESGTRPAG